MTLTRFKQRCIGQLVFFFTNPHIFLGVVMVMVCLVFVLYPALDIFFQSFQVHSGDVRRLSLEVGQWTAAHWERALNSQFSSRTFFKPLLNSLLVSLATTFLAMVVGVVLAWLIVRTDLRWKSLIGGTILLPYILPSWTLSMAWLALFRHDGLLPYSQGVLQHFTGLSVPDFWVYGPLPIIIVLSVHFFAYTYLLSAAGFATIDSSLEETAEIHGATQIQIIRQITVPLALPAIMSAFVLTFAASLGTFGVPYYLGRRVGFSVISTHLYGNMNMGRPGDAFVLATTVVLLSGIALYVNTQIIGKRRQYTTMTGKGNRRSITPLGRWRSPLSLILVIFSLLVGVFPMLLLILQSLQRRLGDYSFANFTLDPWIGGAGSIDVVYSGVLRDPRVGQATMNTVVLGLTVGIISIILIPIIGYIVARGRGTRLSKLVEQLSFLPYIIPGVAFGAIYFTMWAVSRGPIPALYGTLSLLILAAAVKRMPYAARAGIASMLQIGRELEEAAIIHGASWIASMRHVFLPLIRHGLFVGFILVFIHVLKDLSLMVMLVSPRTQVLTVSAMAFNDSGIEQLAYAIAVIIIAITLVGTAIAKKITRGDPLKVFQEGGGN